MSSRQLTHAVLILLLVLATGFCLLANPKCHATKVGGGEPTIERTTNKNSEQFRIGFRKDLLSLTIDEAGAHFRFRENSRKYKIGSYSGTDDFQIEFTLSKPGQKFYHLDHHGGSEFIVKSIMADSLVIRFETSFSHHSFGKNLVTEDFGEFTINAFAGN